MDSKKRAEKIAGEMWRRLYPNGQITLHEMSIVIPIITSQLDEAQHDILEQSEPVVKMRIDEAVKEASAIAVREAQREWIMERTYIEQKAIESGFAAAREKAAGIADSMTHVYKPEMDMKLIIAERIRAMEADK